MGESETVWQGTGPIVYSFSIESPNPGPGSTHYGTVGEAWRYRLNAAGAPGEYETPVPGQAFLSDTKNGVIRNLAEYIDLGMNDEHFRGLPRISPENMTITDSTGEFRGLDARAIFAAAKRISETPPPQGEPVYIVQITGDNGPYLSEKRDRKYGVRIMYEDGFPNYTGLTDEQSLKEGVDKFSNMDAMQVPAAIAKYMITTAQGNNIKPSPYNTKIINFSDNQGFTLQQVSNMITSMLPQMPPMQMQSQRAMQYMEAAQGQRPMDRTAMAPAGPPAEKGEIAKASKVAEAENEAENEQKATTPKKKDSMQSFAFYKPKYGFESVIGMEYAKKYFHDNVILGLEKPELFAKYKKSVHDGFILYGPPGIGKTYLISGLAKEANANLLVVNLHQLLDEYVGNTEKNIHRIFETARNGAPCIILFDEIDGLGASRSTARQHGNQASTLALHQLLTEMDSIESENENVVIIGTTNSPQDVDNALLRSGRFTNLLYIRPPDKEDRSRLFEFYTEGIPKNDLDYKMLGEESHNLSPADISAAVKASVTQLAVEDNKTGKTQELTMKDLLKAIRARRASGSSMIKWYEEQSSNLKKGKFSAEDKLLYGEMIKDIKNRVTQPKATHHKPKMKLPAIPKGRLKS